MPEIEIVNESNSEQALAYAKHFEAELKNLGITRLFAHGSRLESLMPNTLYVYSSFKNSSNLHCTKCSNNIARRRLLVQNINIMLKDMTTGRFTVPTSINLCSESGYQNDSQSLCDKHKEGFFGEKYIPIFDESTVPLADYIPSENIIIIERDITHSYTPVGRSFFAYVLNKVNNLIPGRGILGTFDEILTENLFHSEHVFTRLEQFHKEIEKCKKAYVTDVNAYSRAQKDFFDQFRANSDKIADNIKKLEEKRLKQKYEGLINQVSVQKERELSELKEKYANNFAIHNLQKQLPALQKEGFNIHLYMRPDNEDKMSIHLLKKVKITFTCSSSFGTIIKPIKPPVSMSLYMGAALSKDCTKITSYRVFKEVCPVKNIEGIHFMSNGQICLGDANHLTGKTIEELPASIKELVKLFENASFHHGVSILPEYKNMFPKRVIKIYVDWINRKRKSRGDDFITEEEVFDENENNNDETE